MHFTICRLQKIALAVICATCKSNSALVPCTCLVKAIQKSGNILCDSCKQLKFFFCFKFLCDAICLFSVEVSFLNVKKIQQYLCISLLHTAAPKYIEKAEITFTLTDHKADVDKHKMNSECKLMRFVDDTDNNFQTVLSIMDNRLYTYTTHSNSFFSIY